jgi:intein/homing endonuclease
MAGELSFEKNGFVQLNGGGNGTTHPTRTIPDIQKILEQKNLLHSYAGDDRIVPAAEYLKISEQKRQGAIRHAIAMRRLSELLEGLGQGEIVTISGATGNGKTLLAKSINRGLMTDDVKTVFFSYEVNASTVVKSYGEQNMNMYLPLRLEAMNIEWLFNRIHEAKVKYGCEVVFIDHLHYLVDMAIKQNVSLNIGAVMRTLKQKVAMALNMTVVLLTHTQQPKWDEEPNLGQIRDCLPAGEMVYSDGRRIPVEKVGVGMPVVSRKSIRALQPDTVTGQWAAGAKEILEITTKRGRVLRCSTRHRLYAMTFGGGAFGPNQRRGVQGWTHAEDLKVGQKIAAVRRYPDISNPRSDISYKQAVVLGWIVGDGHITKKGHCEVTVNTRGETEILAALMPSWSAAITVVPYVDAKAFRCYVNGRRSGLRKFFRETGFFPTGVDKHVPPSIFEHDKGVVAGFLQGLFHADGSANFSSVGKSMLVVVLNTISERLAREVQHLLLRLGILSTVRKYAMKNPFKGGAVSEIWAVVITGSDILSFAASVGFLGEKNSKLIDKMGQWRPKDVRREADQDIVYERIKSIRKIGVMETYDLSVEGHHGSLANNSFCVSDILVHNSSLIAQESDSVLMISRIPDTVCQGHSKLKTYDEGRARIYVEKARWSGVFKKRVDVVKEDEWLVEQEGQYADVYLP